MAGNTGNSSSSTTAPYFNGEGYNLWSLKMETLLLSRKLWGVVDKGFDEEDDDVQSLEDNVQKNAKALFLMQQALEERILIRISGTRVAKKAWDILKKEYQGCSKSSAAKLHSYRQEYENLRMKNGESVQDYISRVLTTAYHIQALGEELDEKAIVGKILRSLSLKFRHVVSSIIEANDLSILTVDELSRSLKGHEGRLDMESDQVEVKAFHIKGEGSSSNSTDNAGRGKGHGGFRGRGRGRRRGRGLRRRMLMLMVKKIRPTSNAIIVRSTATTNHSVGTRRV
ncbi:uncharacterized protein LOC120282718 [Dioscorea cayenensis subsp. rotundata]|uniref:Uncharacterized protein LOC120282718 n=1 Tax=Dioscorea cayennensis subsp. rotundata TaxID=55577 RepID=A0AB40D3Z6_DIOCR|nr:uncharacterized protein LOC120282718 [Dioscorea cayenensis subsp. rotundata]